MFFQSSGTSIRKNYSRQTTTFSRNYGFSCSPNRAQRAESRSIATSSSSSSSSATPATNNNSFLNDLDNTVNQNIKLIKKSRFRKHSMFKPSGGCGCGGKRKTTL